MKSYFYDLVCVGGGGAAIMAAISAAKDGKKVAIVSKEPVGFGNTRMAVGLTAYPGIAMEDSPEVFAEDVLKSGETLSNPKLVNRLAKEAATTLSDLENMGPIFRRNSAGVISEDTLLHIGGHSYPRTVANLGGGFALGSTLKSTLYNYNVDLFENTLALELVNINGAIAGLLAFELQSSCFASFNSPATILATGGCSALYHPHTTNSAGATGDGLALALEAGVPLLDMEQIQAIPFGITHPFSMVGTLCGEPTTAGPAGILMDNKGKVILEKGINKLTRAELVKAMMLNIVSGETTPYGGLLLDLEPNLALPQGDKIYKAMKSIGIFNAIKYAYGLEAYRWQEPWDVMPTMHYQMGGIQVDQDGATGIDGLYAAGEVQAGIHGANRLGSVALTEVFSFGRYCGQNLAPQKTDFPENSQEAFNEKEKKWQGIFFYSQKNHQPVALKKELQKVMWEKVGIIREESKLLQALEEIKKIKENSKSLKIEPEDVFNRQYLDAIELHHMLPVAQAIVLSALEKQESRGAHLRLDYPEKNEENLNNKHSIVKASKNGVFSSGLFEG